MAGRRGIVDAVFAAIDQKEAKKVNERANGLLKNVLTEDERKNMIFRPKPMLPVLKENALQSIKTGASAAFGTYAAAVVLVLVRNILSFSLEHPVERCTVIGTLGKGSVVAATAALAGIAVCAAGSVLGTYAGKEAEGSSTAARGIRRRIDRICSSRFFHE